MKDQFQRALRGLRKGFAQAFTVILVTISMCFMCVSAALAAHPDGWPETLSVDMLSDEQKAQIAAAYSDVPEQGTPEAFVDMWGAWWAACLSSNESAESVALYKQSWLCEIHEEFHETSGRTSQDHETFTDWQGGTGLLQALIGNYSQGIHGRNKESTIAAATASMNTKAGGGNKDAQNASWAVAGAATTAGVDKNVVEAVSNPSSQIAKFVNQLKKDGVGAISEAIKLMNSAFRFEADADWFRSTYAAAAGIGLLLLAGNFVVGITRAARGNLPASEAFGKLGASLVCGMGGLLFTPALAYSVSTLVDAAGDGVASLVGASQDSLTGSLLNPTTAMTTESTPLGWMGTILVFVLCFIAGVMLMLSLAAQLVTAYFSAVALGVMWGFATSEKGRERLKRVGAFFLSALIAKPVILFFLWVAMRVSAAYSATVDGWSENPMETLMRVTLSLIAVLMVAVSPAWVAKFIPVAGGAAGGFSRGSLASGAAGGAVSGAAVAFGNRMERFSSASRYRSGSRQGTPGTPGGSGPSGGSGGSGTPGGHGRQGGGALRLVAGKIRRGGGKVVRGGGVVLGAAGDAGRVAGQGARSVAAPLLDAAEGSTQSAERSLS